MYLCGTKRASSPATAMELVIHDRARYRASIAMHRVKIPIATRSDMHTQHSNLVVRS